MDDHRPCTAVPRHFANLRLEQRKKQKELKQTLHGHCLPVELWNYIIDMFVVPEKAGLAFFCFLRREVYYQATYNFFAGTEAEFKRRIDELQEEVTEIKKTSRALEDELLDTPMCTWCNKENCQNCPDMQGNKCESHWSLERTFSSKTELLTKYATVLEWATRGYYNKVEVSFL
jgi:hypothetical protein